MVQISDLFYVFPGLLISWKTSRASKNYYGRLRQIVLKGGLMMLTKKLYFSIPSDGSRQSLTAPKGCSCISGLLPLVTEVVICMSPKGGWLTLKKDIVLPMLAECQQSEDELICCSALL